jgi:hypothetical protein
MSASPRTWLLEIAGPTRRHCNTASAEHEHHICTVQCGQPEDATMLFAGTVMLTETMSKRDEHTQGRQTDDQVAGPRTAHWQKRAKDTGTWCGLYPRVGAR